MFLTQCYAKDASQQKSIPIIGLATWKHEWKYAQHEPYALLAADFDQSDPYRDRNRAWTGKDHSASIIGIINETLRALREVEELEIARAKGMPLRLDENHRWTSSDKVTEECAANPSRSMWQKLTAALTHS